MLWMTPHATEKSHFLNRCFIPGLLAFRILVKSDPQTPIGFDPLQSNTTLNNIARLESYSHGETGDQILYCLLLSGLDFFWWLYFLPSYSLSFSSDTVLELALTFFIPIACQPLHHFPPTLPDFHYEQTHSSVFSFYS